jgi:PAS domain S-box-containing protein/excisionase family DNA binding protein
LPSTGPLEGGDDVNLKQAAASLGVHYQTAYRWVRAGDLAALRIGAHYEISDAAIHQFLTTRRSVLRQAMPDPSADCSHAHTDPDQLLRDLDAMASDPLVTVPALSAFAARGGREALGDLCIVICTNDDGSIESAGVDHPHRDWAAFVLSALIVTGPAAPRLGTLLEPALKEGRVVRIPHVPQDRLRAGLRPEIRQHLASHPVAGLLAAPVHVDADVRGMVVFARDAAANPYTEADAQFALEFANRVGKLVMTAREIAGAWAVREMLAQRFRQSLANAPLRAPFDHATVQTLLDAVQLAAPVVVYDATGRILGANAATERIAGYGRRDLIQMTYEDVVGPEDAAAERENLARLADGELDYHDFHADRRRSDGTVVDFAMHRVAVRHLDSTLACIISVGRPVRLTRRGEHLTQTN